MGVVADVNLLAEERVAGLGEVNSDLVRATGLESTRDETHAAESLEHLDVGHGVLSCALGRMASSLLVLDASAKAVSAVFHEAALEASRARGTVDEREVAALNRVRPKLRREGLLCGPGASEDQEAARVLVDAVDDSNARSAAAGTESVCEECTDAPLDGVLVGIVERHGRDTGGLLDDEDLRVGEDHLEGRPLGALVGARCVGGDDDLRLRRNLLRAVGPHDAVHGDLPPLHELPSIAPADAKLVPQLSVERRRFLG